MRTKENQACYGINSVKFAIDNNAVETVLISDNLFRAKNVKTRREYVQLSETAENYGI